MNASARLPWLDRACAIFVPRTILGFVYLFDGIHVLADVGAVEFGRRMAQSDGARVLPGAVLTTIGMLTPFFDLLLGALLLAGLWVRPTLRVLAVLLILITASYGVHGLLHPIGATAMDVAIVNFYILPRAALLMVVLLQGREDDRLSLDALTIPTRRQRSRR